MKKIKLLTVTIIYALLYFCITIDSIASVTQDFQSELHSISKSACTEYSNSANDIQRSEVYNNANELKLNFGQNINWNFSNWEGNIMLIRTNQGGDYADVSIVSEKNNITLSFKDTRSLGSGGVSNDEPAFSTLRELQEGDPVIFSGRLEQSDDRGIFEYSFSERGSLCSPEFSFKLHEISLNPSGEIRKSDSELFMDGIKEGFEIVVWVFVALVVLIIIGNTSKKQ